MIDKKIPLTIEGINESIYGDFSMRLASFLFDTLILLPYGFLALYISGLSKNAYLFTILPSLIVNFLFSIYLVKRYGGTPGKLVVGIKILKLNGADVTWREAILRESVDFAFKVFATAITLYALSKATSEHYDSVAWLQKRKYLFTLIPVLYGIYNWTNQIWIWSEFLFLSLNERRRALHDFIAGTVIVKTKYIEKIREAINADHNQSTNNIGS